MAKLLSGTRIYGTATIDTTLSLGTSAIFTGSTSGTTTVLATAVAGTTTLTLPAATDTLVGKATTDTLTNKTISGATNTLSSIANSSLTNSSVTIGNTAIALGASSTTLAGLTTVTSASFVGPLTGNASTATALANARTISLTGDVAYTSGSFDGSANVTGIATLSSVGTTGTYTKVTTDAKGRVISGTTLVAADIPNLDTSKITSGIIDSARLPSYVDDVIEGSNLAAFPATGETGKIYVALDTNKTYRWSGSAYIFITSGAVDSVAGKTGVVTLVKGDVGLGNVDNTADSTKSVASASTLTTARNINGTSFNGSADITITAANPNALTIGTGLSGTSYTGSSAVTIAIDSTVATLTGTQTLTNKTHDNTNSYVTKASLFTLQDATDATKQANFVLSGLTTGTNYTYTLPAITGTLLSSGNISQSFGGPISFSNNVTVNGNGVVTIGPTTGTANLIFGQSTVSQTTSIQAGATASGSTKTINIGTGGLTGSTTAIAIGSTFGTTVAANGTWTYSTPLANSNLANSSVTIGSTAVSLGSTVTTFVGLTLNNTTLTGTITAGGGVGTNGQILSSTGTGVQWISQATSNSVFIANARSDLGYVYDASVTITEDLLGGTAFSVTSSSYDLGALQVDGIVSLENLDSSVKSDYLAQAIIFGF